MFLSVLGLDGAGAESGDLGFSKWLENIQGKPGLWVLFLAFPLQSQLIFAFF